MIDGENEIAAASMNARHERGCCFLGACLGWPEVRVMALDAVPLSRQMLMGSAVDLVFAIEYIASDE
ncbi:hypothetical protein [Comamonas aquatilis]|uniref:hypothetical protein n=1 Tax=Comamonas aquatilis TaxID=1778406 RepID=UPI0039F0BDA0